MKLSGKLAYADVKLKTKIFQEKSSEFCKLITFVKALLKLYMYSISRVRVCNKMNTFSKISLENLSSKKLVERDLIWHIFHNLSVLNIE